MQTNKKNRTAGNLLLLGLFVSICSVAGMMIIYSAGLLGKPEIRALFVGYVIGTILGLAMTVGALLQKRFDGTN